MDGTFFISSSDNENRMWMICRVIDDLLDRLHQFATQGPSSLRWIVELKVSEEERISKSYFK